MNRDGTNQPASSPQKVGGGGGLVRGLAKSLSSRRLSMKAGGMLSPLGGKKLQRTSSAFFSPNKTKSPPSLFGSKRNLKVEYDDDDNDYDDGDSDYDEVVDDRRRRATPSSSPSRGVDRRSALTKMKRSGGSTSSFRNLTDSFRMSSRRGSLSYNAGMKNNNASYSMREIEDFEDVDFDRLERELKSKKSIEKREQTLLLLCKELGMMDE